MSKSVLVQDKKPYHEIGSELRQQIIDGLYPVGTKLPPERNIAEKYGVSRTIIREALLMLELEGIVDIRQSSGVYVIRMPSESNDDSQFQTAAGPFEMLQAQQFLESNIAAFAATMATRTDIDNLRQVLEQEQRAIAINDPSPNNIKMFHLLMARATHNQFLVETVENLWNYQENSQIWLQLRSHIEDRTYRLKWLSEHQAILAALRRRDVTGAWQATWQYIENIKNILMEVSDADSPDFDGYLFESVPIIQGQLV